MLTTRPQGSDSCTWGPVVAGASVLSGVAGVTRGSGGVAEATSDSAMLVAWRALSVAHLPAATGLTETRPSEAAKRVRHLLLLTRSLVRDDATDRRQSVERDSRRVASLHRERPSCNALSLTSLSLKLAGQRRRKPDPPRLWVK